jgi:hypothetical protein
MTTRSQFPLNAPVIDRDGRMAKVWASYFMGWQQSFPNPNGRFIEDMTWESTGATSFYRMSGRPASAPGTVLFNLENYQIETIDSGGVWRSFTPTFTGDVWNNPGSTTLVLRDVNTTPGTFSSGGLSLKVDTKGRVTKVEQVPHTAEVLSVNNKTGSVFLTTDNIPEGAERQYFANDLAREAISVTGKGLEYNNTSGVIKSTQPLTTKGDLSTHDSTNLARLPVGNNEDILTVDSNTSTGLAWKPKNEIVVPFSYGDASPKKAITIPGGKRIVKVELVIDVVFDSQATLSIGSFPNELMATEDNSLQMQAVFSTEPGTKYQSATDVNLYINPNMASQGSGVVIITFK